MVIAILAVLGGAVIFAVGYIASSGGYGSADLTIETDAGGAGTPCDVLCRKWKRRRAEACTAIMAVRLAAKAQAAANAALVSAVATAALLLAAAVAASFIPFLGSVIAASLFAIYATAQVYVLYLLGGAASAARCGVRRSQGSHDSARRSPAKAEAALKEGCSDTTALALCLATPSPCSGVPVAQKSRPKEKRPALKVRPSRSNRACEATCIKIQMSVGFIHEQGTGG